MVGQWWSGQISTIIIGTVIIAISSWLPLPYYHLSYLSLITSTLDVTLWAADTQGGCDQDNMGVIMVGQWWSGQVSMIWPSLMTNATLSWLPLPYYHPSYPSLITSTLRVTSTASPLNCWHQSIYHFVVNEHCLPKFNEYTSLVTLCDGFLKISIHIAILGVALGSFSIHPLRNQCLPQNRHCIGHHHYHLQNQCQSQGEEEGWLCPCICCYKYAGPLESS